MRTKTKRASLEDELALAIGLVWGHLNASQFDEAYDLAHGCLQVWPNEPRLVLMAAYAAVELLEPLDEETMEVLRSADCQDWVNLVLQRAKGGIQEASDPESKYLH